MENRVISALKNFLSTTLPADPGRTRFRTAVWITAASGLTFILFTLLSNTFHQSNQASFLGVFVALATISAVNDPTLHQQKITTLMAIPVAALSVVLPMIAAPLKWLAYSLFVVDIFVDVYVRRFGPRGKALGMVSFLTYFAAMFFPITFRELPWILATIAIGVFIAYVLRFIILRDRPQLTFIHFLRAYQSTLEKLLSQLEQILSSPASVDSPYQPARKSLNQLTELFISMENMVNQLKLDSGSGNGNGQSGQVDAIQTWRNDLYEIEISAEALADVAWKLSGSGSLSLVERKKLAQVLEKARASIKSNPTSPHTSIPDAETLIFPFSNGNQAASEKGTLEKSPLLLAMYRFTWAARSLSEVHPWSLPDPLARELGQSGRLPKPPGMTSDKSTGISPFQQAVQAAVAGGLAILAGLLLSPARWYWAVIAAFVVFARANTIEEKLSRAWARAFGTFIGLAGGLILAEIVRGQRGIEYALLFLGIFLGYYLIQVSYTGFVFFLTVILAMLFELLGKPVAGILVVRVEETAVGAAIGFLVTLFIFPYHSGQKIQPMMKKALQKMAKALEKVQQTPVSQNSPNGLLKLSTEIDKEVQSLRSATNPLNAFSVIPLPGSKKIKSEASSLSILAFCVRHYLAAVQIAADDQEFLKRLIPIDQRLAQNVQTVASDMGKSQTQSIQPAEDLIQQTYQKLPSPEAGEDHLILLRWLDRIDRQLDRLAQDQGIELNSRES